MEQMLIMNRKIGFLIMNFENGGGTERVTSIIANELLDRNYDITIYSCQKGNKCKFSIDDRVHLCSLEGEKYKNPIWRKIQVIKKLIEHVKKDKIDVMIAVDVALYLYLIPLQIDHLCKCVAWEHFNYYISPNKMVKYARKMAVKYADCVVVLGKNDLENYKKNCKKIKRLTYIYNPIAVNIEPKADMKSKKIIAMGRLNSQKGFDFLIEAWAKLESDFKDWEVNIFGEGLLKEQLQKQIDDKELKKIFLRGYSKDVSKDMAESSIFVFSSRYEGFGLVLLEAQAIGLPCVSFDCKEGPAEIIDDGVNGFLVEPLNVNLLSEKMRTLMKNEELRKQFSEKSTKDLGKFERSQIIDKWDKLLSEL